MDGDGDQLAVGAIEAADGEAVGEAVAGPQFLDGGLAVGGGVAPVAQGIHAEGAVAVAAGGGELRYE
ncbi:hypothetical protein D3C84_1273210 [compost metagenome]